ncbi:hypothetical protein B0H15DRAFT_806857 [Mycena belliarum]|uniref:Uncharacterized protein n=1 Tax=Mycena belliarum TaxID=1033014 RepID=A0AAD6XGT9_9AGAR|nr:hypothetical protein B0H15DRAFT_806857 [Mycena belliae]
MNRYPTYPNPTYSTPGPPRTTGSSSLSRGGSVSWGNKIKGAIQVGHGLGEALRGSLGASDPYYSQPYQHQQHQHQQHQQQHQQYAPRAPGEIAQRGRHEIAQGLARMRGVPLPGPGPVEVPPRPTPLYRRRAESSSYPQRQYEPRRRLRTRRAAPHLTNSNAGDNGSNDNANPSTTPTPFEKFYAHPYLPSPTPQQDGQAEDDPGFAGLGAGAGAGGRKEAEDRIVPAFVVAPPSESGLETPYPSFRRQEGAGAGHGHGYRPGSAPPTRASFAPPLPPRTRNSWNPPASASSARSSVDYSHAPTRSSINAPPSPYASSSAGPSSQDHSHLSVPPDASSTATHEAPSRHRLSSLLDRTSKSMRFAGAGKGKGREKLKKAARDQNMTIASDAFPGRPDAEAQSPDDHLAPSPSPLHRHATAPAHRHEAALETAGYDVLPYDAKDAYPQWPSEAEMRRARARPPYLQTQSRLEPVRRSVRA